MVIAHPMDRFCSIYNMCIKEFFIMTKDKKTVSQKVDEIHEALVGSLESPGVLDRMRTLESFMKYTIKISIWVIAFFGTFIGWALACRDVFSNMIKAYLSIK